MSDSKNKSSWRDLKDLFIDSNGNIRKSSCAGFTKKKNSRILWGRRFSKKRRIADKNRIKEENEIH